MPNEADRFDAFLQDGLNSYVEAEPLAGLEERILNRVNGALPPRRRGYLPALALTGVAAALVGILILIQQQTPSKPVIAPLVARLDSPARPVTAPRSPLPHPRFVKARIQLPKRQIFPTPQPPTAEERAFLHFVHQDPKEAAAVLASLAEQDGKPLEIQPLEIKPLQTESLEK